MAESIFSDGFESGDFSKWTGTSIPTGSTVETVSSPVHQGSYAAHIVRPLDLDVHPDIHEDFSTVSTAYARFYVRFGSLPSPDGASYYPASFGMSQYPHYATWISAYNSGGTVYWTIYMPDDDANWYYSVSSSTVSVDTWYCVEIKKVGASSVGESRLYIDGVEVASITGRNTETKGQCNELSFWADSTGAGLPQIDTYFDCVIIDSSYIGPESSDMAPPTFSNVGTSTSLAGQSCGFDCLISDNVNISTFVFGTNNTGTWTNDTAIAFSNFFNTTAAWANVTKTLNGTVGDVVSYVWYANDTSNNWSSSDQYSLTASALQRYLTVTSPYGTPGGQGWYDNGSTAYATLDTGIVDDGNGTRRVFTSWSADASGASFARSDPITMDENKTAVAVWKTQYNVTFTHSGLDSSGPGKVVTVNGVPVNYDQLPYSFWADSGSIVTYSYDNVSSTTSGKRFTLTGISGPSSPITQTEPTIVTGDYGTQYEVTFDQTAVETDFTGTVVTIDTIDYSRANLPVSFWWNKDSTHNFSFVSPLLVNANKQYDWNTTSGLSTLQNGTLTVTASGSVVGNYLVANRITFDQAGVSPDFAGTVLEVDSNPYNATMLPVSFAWEAGSVHNFTFLSPLIVSAKAKRYVWTSTNGLSNLQSATITVTTYGSIVGNYKTQYYLNLTVNPPGITAPSGSGWHDAGTYTTISTQQYVLGGSRYNFTGWTTPDMSEITDPASTSTTVLVDKAKTVAANYVQQEQVTFAETGLGIDCNGTILTIDGTNYGLSSLPVTFYWNEGSDHTFTYTSPLVVNSNEQYNWTSTSGLSTLQAGTLTITSSGNVTANYVQIDKITFDQLGAPPDFSGVVLIIDGNSYNTSTLPASFMWQAGSVHTFAFSTLCVTPNAEDYTWDSTTGLSSLQSGSITITTYGTITGNYTQTQYSGGGGRMPYAD